MPLQIFLDRLLYRLAPCPNHNVSVSRVEEGNAGGNVIHDGFLTDSDKVWLFTHRSYQSLILVELLTRNIGVKEFSNSEDVPSVILYLNVVHLRQVLLNRQLYA